MACSERVTAVSKGRAPEARRPRDSDAPPPAPPHGRRPAWHSTGSRGASPFCMYSRLGPPLAARAAPRWLHVKEPAEGVPQVPTTSVLAHLGRVGPVGNKRGQTRRWHSRGRHGKPPRRQKSGTKRGPGTRPAVRRSNGSATATGGQAPCPPRPAATAIRRCHTGHVELRRRRGQRRAGPAACNTRTSVSRQGFHCPGRLRD